MLKKKSTHELLPQEIQDKLNSNSDKPNQNFLFVPGQSSNYSNMLNKFSSTRHSNRSSNNSIKISCSASESDYSQHSDDNQESSFNSKKHKKLQKSIRKQRKKNEKQLTSLIQYLYVNNKTNTDLKYDEEDLKYLNSSKNSINTSTNKLLNEFLDPESSYYKNENEKSLTSSRSMDFKFYQNQNNSSNASFASLQPNANNTSNSSNMNTSYERPRFCNSDRETEDEGENFNEENERTITNGDRLTSNGFRIVRRFGYEVEEGCGFPLSLQFLKEINGKNLRISKEDTLKKVKTWPEILEQANDYVNKHLNHNVNSNGINDLFNVCPFPEILFTSVSSVLPFRRWNSELNLTIKQKNQMQKNENHFIENQLDSNSLNYLWKSCEDLRHLTSGNLNLTSEKLLPFDHDLIYSNNLFKFNHKNKHLNCNSNNINYASSECSYSSWRISSSSSNSSSISGMSNLAGMDINILINNPWEVFLQYFNPKLVAIELTKIEIELFLHLNCTEISREIFARTHSLNITQFFEIHCIYLFVQLILKQTELTKRMDCLKLCIELLAELYNLKNWQSFKSILIALRCIPIIRLKHTWLELNTIYPNVYEQFQKLSKFDLINNDHNLLHNHNQPSIPCLTELLNEIRARIAFKLNQINFKPKMFAEPETLTDWLTCEVRNLENLLLINQQMSKDDCDKLHDKDKKKKSNIIRKLLRSFNSKKKKMKFKQPDITNKFEQEETNNSNLNKENNFLGYNQINCNLELNDEDKLDDELILMKTVNSNNCLEEWRQIQIDLKIKLNKLKPEMENSILNEINKCLQLHQRLVLNYKFINCDFRSNKETQESNSDDFKSSSIIRHCLLQLVKLNSNSMQENMKKSLQLEPADEDFV